MTVPLFPLPQLVFFPFTLLPLHIFEPRYRQMVQDSLEGERQIGMVLMKQEVQLGVEAWHSIGAVGRITEVERLDDGGFDIVLIGLSRFKIIEVTQEKPYRLARVQLLRDRLPTKHDRGVLSRLLIKAFLEVTQNQPVIDPKVLHELDFPTLVNSICAAVQIDERFKQELLEMHSLEARADQVLVILERLQSQQKLISQFDHLRPEDAGRN